MHGWLQAEKVAAAKSPSESDKWGPLVGFVSPLREAGPTHLVTGAELAANWGAHLTAPLFQQSPL